MEMKSAGPKNIVICCDGTGNQFGACNSNVVKLYTALIINNEQVGYYHPGLGTMGAPTARTKLGSKWSVMKGLGFGAGFRDAVLDAYRYLMENYADGDHIYLIGFSRGAYTARALAGLLHGYGLLCRGNEGHMPYLWRLFTDQVAQMRKEEKTTIYVQEAFKETFSHPNLKIRFMGLWDTVSSIGWIYTPLRLLYTAHNPTMRCGRHAVSIDERRCFFRDNLWGDALPGQDILQVWFAGVHSDVGGSYPQKQSWLSTIALEWLMNEAEKQGLRLDPDRKEMVLGRPTVKHYEAGSLYNAPMDPLFPIHRSLRGSWWFPEFVPHRYYNKTQRKERWRIPMGQPRHLPEFSVVHPSVAERMDDPRMEYAPKNVPRETLAVHPGHQPGTAADLTGFSVYHSKEKGYPEAASKAKMAAGVTATAAAVACAVLLARKLLG